MSVIQKAAKHFGFVMTDALNKANFVQAAINIREKSKRYID